MYEWADLVVCRAGSTSIAELSIIGRASLLVPFPYATDAGPESILIFFTKNGFREQRAFYSHEFKERINNLISNSDGIELFTSILN